MPFNTKKTNQMQSNAIKCNQINRFPVEMYTFHFITHRVHSHWLLDTNKHRHTDKQTQYHITRPIELNYELIQPISIEILID